jgi:hypothetical protein
MDDLRQSEDVASADLAFLFRAEAPDRISAVVQPYGDGSGWKLELSMTVAKAHRIVDALAGTIEDAEALSMVAPSSSETTSKKRQPRGSKKRRRLQG